MDLDPKMLIHIHWELIKSIIKSDQHRIKVDLDPKRVVHPNWKDVKRHPIQEEYPVHLADDQISELKITLILETFILISSSDVSRSRRTSSVVKLARLVRLRLLLVTFTSNISVLELHESFEVIIGFIFPT